MDLCKVRRRPGGNLPPLTKIRNPGLCQFHRHRPDDLFLLAVEQHTPVVVRRQRRDVLDSPIGIAHASIVRNWDGQVHAARVGDRDAQREGFVSPMTPLAIRPRRRGSRLASVDRIDQNLAGDSCCGWRESFSGARGTFAGSWSTCSAGPIRCGTPISARSIPRDTRCAASPSSKSITWDQPGRRLAFALLANQFRGRLLLQATYDPDLVSEQLAAQMLDTLTADLRQFASGTAAH